MKRKRKLLWVIPLGGILIMTLSLYLILPWTANHFGFALPGQGGLPYRIRYAGRTYANLSTCAHASWCQDHSHNPLCWKKDKIQQMEDSPLTHVGSIFTLFGSPYTIMAPQARIPSQYTLTTIYLAFDTTCYVSYTLEGGP